MIRFRRLMIPVFYCLAAACAVEIPLFYYNPFGQDIILWDTLFRTIAAVPGLLYFYKEDRVFRGESTLDGKGAVLLFAAGAAVSAAFRIGFDLLEIPGYEAVEKSLFTGNLWLGIPVLLAASPLLEELFFRGVIYGRLKEIVSVRSAVLISAVCFGLYHGNPVQGIYGALMGVVLAAAMERYQTLLAPLLFHMGANLTAVLFSLI